MRLYAVFIIACIAIWLSPISFSYALVAETQALSFGTFAIQNNNGAYDLQITPTGSVNADPQFIVIAPGQEAQYAVAGFPASTALIITVAAADLTRGGGDTFSLVNFQTSPATVITTGAGTATFGLGATLRTSGSTSMYTDDNYSGAATVSVNF